MKNNQQFRDGRVGCVGRKFLLYFSTVLEDNTYHKWGALYLFEHGNKNNLHLLKLNVAP